MPSRQPLVAITGTAIDPAAVLAAVGDDEVGAAVCFVGTVRRIDEGRVVTKLTYEAHPGAEAAMATIVRRVIDGQSLLAAAAVHRVGELAVGDIAVVVAAASEHRAEAFKAAQQIIDEVKAEVAIWKLQRFDDGGDEWVGSP